MTHFVSEFEAWLQDRLAREIGRPAETRAALHLLQMFQIEQDAEPEGDVLEDDTITLYCWQKADSSWSGYVLVGESRVSVDEGLNPEDLLANIQAFGIVCDRHEIVPEPHGLGIITPPPPVSPPG